MGFKNIRKTILPRYELPSHSYLSREAQPLMHIQDRHRLAKSACCRHFGLTSRTCEPYMSATVHYIQHWEMKTVSSNKLFSPGLADDAVLQSQTTLGNWWVVSEKQYSNTSFQTKAYWNVSFSLIIFLLCVCLQLCALCSSLGQVFNMIFDWA